MRIRRRTLFWCAAIALAAAPPMLAPTASAVVIVGGIPVKIEDFPWQVGIVRNDPDGQLRGVWCGGVVIAQNYILTAAHCVDAVEDKRSYGEAAPAVQLYRPDRFRVLIGATELSVGGTTIEIAEIVVHDGWKRSPYPMDYDAALLRLKTPVDPKLAIRLRSRAINATLGNAWVSGWGATETASYSDHLRAVSIPIVAQGTCGQQDGYRGYISPRMVCAGYQEGRKDSCVGDSGGPLVMGDRAKPMVVGLVSWGIGCAAPLQFGVYTRIDVIGSWIERETAQAAVWTTADPGPLFNVTPVTLTKGAPS